MVSRFLFVYIFDDDDYFCMSLERRGYLRECITVGTKTNLGMGKERYEIVSFPVLTTVLCWGSRSHFTNHTSTSLSQTWIVY